MRRCCYTFLSLMLFLVTLFGIAEAEFTFVSDSSNETVFQMFMSEFPIEAIREKIVEDGGYYNGDKKVKDGKQYYFSQVLVIESRVRKITITTFYDAFYTLEAIVDHSENPSKVLDNLNAMITNDKWTISTSTQEDNSQTIIIILPTNVDDFMKEYMPAPTPTPRPTPLPASYPIEFQETKGYNNGKYAYVEEYAKNIGETSLEYVLIRVTFIDNDGHVLDIDSTYVGSLSKLRPGDREYFHVTIKKPGKDWRYRVELESYR